MDVSELSNFTICWNNLSGEENCGYMLKKDKECIIYNRPLLAPTYYCEFRCVSIFILYHAAMEARTDDRDSNLS